MSHWDDMQPLVELYVAADKGDTWRSVVVAEDCVLWNLHRIVQISLGKKDPLEDKVQPTLSFQGKALAGLKGSKLNAAAGPAFLSGKVSLAYKPARGAYTIKAVKRANGRAERRVPRCIGSSDEDRLDTVNGKLMRTRFSTAMERNKKKKQALKVYAPAWVTSQQLWESYVRAMQNPVDADEKEAKKFARAEARAAVKAPTGGKKGAPAAAKKPASKCTGTVKPAAKAKAKAKSTAAKPAAKTKSKAAAGGKRKPAAAAEGSGQKRQRRA